MTKPSSSKTGAAAYGPLPLAVLVDDDAEVREAYTQTLELARFEVIAKPSAAAGLAVLSAAAPAIVITDVRMPGLDGLGFLDAIRAIDPEIPVILITGHGDIPMAVTAVRAGAWDFLQKPVDPEHLVEVARRASAYRRLTVENRLLRQNAGASDPWEQRIVGKSPAAVRCRRTLAKLADADAGVLLVGETGTGKEVAARALHELGRRRQGHFVAVNCGALPETMIESELFGHETGAFTGARERRIGKIEHASGGTLFLDEIESMPLAAQTRLLRAIQEQKIERLGSNKETGVDIRVIAATKTDLRRLAERGLFREDLVYRLDVLSVHLPPLRDRREDIPLLFAYFLDLAAKRAGRAAPPADWVLMDRLTHQDWPGNVRELRNAAERFLYGIGEIGGGDAGTGPDAAPGSLEEQMDLVERRLIEAALTQSGRRVGVTADALGISRKTLYLKMRKHGLAASDAGGD
jgi:two-component system, NtrC family, C4-dicarboxylate transport response regulator DctD